LKKSPKWSILTHPGIFCEP